MTLPIGCKHWFHDDICIHCGFVRKHEPEPTEAAQSHVCGLEGYGYPGDPPCPGCEHGRKKAEREAVVVDPTKCVVHGVTLESCRKDMRTGCRMGMSEAVVGGQAEKICSVCKGVNSAFCSACMNGLAETPRPDCLLTSDDGKSFKSELAEAKTALNELAPRPGDPKDMMIGGKFDVTRQEMGKESWAESFFKVGICHHSRTKPDCPSCLLGHAARMEMQLNKMARTEEWQKLNENLLVITAERDRLRAAASGTESAPEGARRAANEISQKNWVRACNENDGLTVDEMTDIIAKFTKSQPSSLTPPNAFSALKRLYEETADYIRINNLGDVHHNQSMKDARDVLASPLTQAGPEISEIREIANDLYMHGNYKERLIAIADSLAAQSQKGGGE